MEKNKKQFTKEKKKIPSAQLKKAESPEILKKMFKK